MSDFLTNNTNLAVEAVQAQVTIPDANTLRITVATNDLPATFRGVGITNLNGAGQTVRLKLVNASASRVFFNSENAGSAIDDLRLKGQAITGNRILVEKR